MTGQKILFRCTPIAYVYKWTVKRSSVQQLSSLLVKLQLDRFKNQDKPIVITKEIKQDTRKEREEKERAEREARREARRKEEEEKKKRRTPPIREWDRDKIRQSQEREEAPRRGRSRSRSPRRGRPRSRERDTRRDRRGTDL
jgi:hypothetical protein